MTGLHPFIGSNNPRNQNSCLKCGLPKDHPVHKVLSSV